MDMLSCDWILTPILPCRFLSIILELMAHSSAYFMSLQEFGCILPYHLSHTWVLSTLPCWQSYWHCPFHSCERFSAATICLNAVFFTENITWLLKFGIENKAAINLCFELHLVAFKKNMNIETFLKYFHDPKTVSKQHLFCQWQVSGCMSSGKSF